MTRILTIKKSLIFTLALVLILLGQTNVYLQTSTEANTIISNASKGRYEDKDREIVDTVSPTVEVIVRAISSLAVTPNEGTPSEVVAPNETITRQFRICNTSNSNDSFTITAASISAPAQITGIFYDADANGIISSGDIQITLNQALSNSVNAGSCIGILVKIDTNDFPSNENLRINLSARSNNISAVNGAATDSGTIINSGGKGATLTNPGDPTLIPQKLVQNAKRYVAGRNEQLEYSITFRNSGDVDARNVVITDELAPELNYVANTLKLNDKALTDAADSDEGEFSGKRVIVKLGSPVKPNEIVRVTFMATVTGSTIPGQGVINVAQISAANAKTTDTTQAIAVIDPFGTVYAARGGESSPVPGAQVEISTDQNGTPISIPAGQGFEPNLDNTNPFLTDNRGRFSFGLDINQLGTSTQPATYVVRVNADNFRSRLLQITIRPLGNGLFEMTVRSLDGLPIAVADGFELTDTIVIIPSIADVAFNIPLFEDAILEVTKTVDRIQAEIGDIANYRVEIGNSSVAPILDVVVKDTLPDSFSYVPDTAQIIRDGKTSGIVPSMVGNVMEFNIGDLRSGERLSIQYRVRIGVNAIIGDNYNAAVVSGTFPSGEVATSAVSKALVKVGQGLFSMKQFLIGRVFVDENRNNVFDKGEKAVAGARVYSANGNSATTDSNGLYSIPSISHGAQLVALDPITVPQGHFLKSGKRRSGKSWTRLLRTPLGGGGMLRQNFALVSDGSDISSEDNVINTSADTTTVSDFAQKFRRVTKTSEEVKYETVLPGAIIAHGISNAKVIPDPALNVNLSVAQDWTVNVELNGTRIGNDSIGSTRKDPSNQITTYSFIGLGLKPGPNKLRATPVSPTGEAGKTVEYEIFGRGAAKRLKINTERNELQASGRDSTLIVIEAFDQWENPAQDGSVIVQTSSGQLVVRKSSPDSATNAASKVVSSDLLQSNGKTSEQVNNTNREQKVDLLNGVGVVRLISDNKTGVAKITAIQGQTEASTDIRFTSEMRPQFLAGLAELTIGKNAPDMINRGVNENIRGHVQFFYKGKIFGDKNLLTLAYDSQEPLNRISGQDRLFQLNPLDHVYSLFGDSSTRFQETESNSKVYARFDRGRSYAMFGDIDSGLETTRLLGYNRRLTGAKVHIENERGDHVTVTGARPDTSFARQVIPGGSLGLVQLAFGDILPGSEVFSIEVRDRRNPELIISREILSRSVDYNIDTTTGTIFFLRPIPTFDRDLNLIQVVATYEYRSEGFESSVYTARASKTFEKIGLRLGFSYINQKQNDDSPFQLGGLDATLKLPNRGKLNFEWARSNGELNGGFGFFGNTPDGNLEHNGDAFFVSVEQPISSMQSALRFEGFSASRGFYNPFGATVTPGSTRGALVLESKPLKNSTLKVNLIGEKNLTDNVDNNRITAGISWSQVVSEKLRLNLGYDLRKFSDNDTDKSIVSNLFTVGANYKPTSKLDFSIKREQNLGDEDPSFPNQTLIGANYQFSQNAKLFFTQRLASNPITPIADVSETGFASSNARYETALGIETRFSKYTSMSGRYQLESGVNGTDSFSIIGLQNRLPITEKVSLEIGYERAFHIAGEGESYNNVTFGGNWLPDENFRTTFRYELRDRNGFGQLFSLGAAGRFRPGWTTMGRFQYGDIDFNGRKNLVMNGQLALAIRPHDTDKYGFLLSYKHRESFFSTADEDTPNELRNDLFSVDGFHQTTRRLELFGRFAAKFTSDRTPSLPQAENLTWLMQGRAQYMLNNWFDVAAEGRYTYQPTSGSRNRWVGIEAGYWATPDLRIGGGYNFSKSEEVFGFNNNDVFKRGGFYFTISTKISRLFDLFGTKKDGLEYHEQSKQNSKNPKIAKKKKQEDR